MRALERKEVQELRADLEALRAELRSFLDASAESSRPVDLTQPIGRVSRMDALQQQSMAKANRLAAEQRLQRVDAALRQLAADESEFGSCLQCEEPIGFKRLKARPEAALCIICQGKRETSADR